MSTINNLKINNNVFAQCLSKYNLVYKGDILVERCDSLDNSILLTETFNRHNDRIILTGNGEVTLDNMMANFSNEERERTINFVCNGVFNDSEEYIRKMLENGAFNVGICTSDEKMYNDAKRFYSKIRGELLAIGVPVTQIDYLDDLNNTYILSYRKGK